MALVVYGHLFSSYTQKVLIARWMNRSPRLLLLDEPTQGVDVGTRQQIFSALREAARNGMTVVCASSEAEQLALLCDRVLIFAKGAIVRELTGDDVHAIIDAETRMESEARFATPDYLLDRRVARW